MQSSPNAKAAFTRLELLIVVTLFLLLLAAALPTLRQSRLTAGRTACLSNLQQLAVATHSYALEDPHEQIIPLHSNMVSSVSFWEWRSANWHTWGGPSATELFRTGPDCGLWLSDDPKVPAGGRAVPDSGDEGRLLNPYVAHDTRGVYRCPADAGLPSGFFTEAYPTQNAQRSLWHTLGNSYRANLLGFTQGSAGSDSDGHYSIGPWGQRSSRLPDPARLVLVADTPFYGLAAAQSGLVAPPKEGVKGWHGEPRTDNALYVDGSGRPTLADGRPPTADGDLGNPTVCRGTNFRLDTFPDSGTNIWGDWAGFFPAFAVSRLSQPGEPYFMP